MFLLILDSVCFENKADERGYPFSSGAIRMARKYDLRSSQINHRKKQFIENHLFIRNGDSHTSASGG